MKRLTILLFSVLGMATALHAQTKQVSGRLVDDNRQPVAFANVVLKHIDNDSILVGTTSDENGAFVLNLSGQTQESVNGQTRGSAPTYRLIASSAGYERVEVRCGMGDLGELTMSAKQLDAVTITASRTTEEVDRFVVLPKKEEVEAAGRTLVLLDMLNLPGLRVDVALQSITVDGGIAILQINGKEVPLARLQARRILQQSGHPLPRPRCVGHHQHHTERARRRREHCGAGTVGTQHRLCQRLPSG